jgi:hypothetical protein
MSRNAIAWQAASVIPANVAVLSRAHLIITPAIALLVFVSSSLDGRKRQDRSSAIFHVRYRPLGKILFQSTSARLTTRIRCTNMW